MIRSCGHQEYVDMCLDCQYGEPPIMPDPDDNCIHGIRAGDCKWPHSPHLQHLICEPEPETMGPIDPRNNSEPSKNENYLPRHYFRFSVMGR